jgi:hypothetical protein
MSRMAEQQIQQDDRENLSGLEYTAFMSWVGMVEKDSEKLIKENVNDKRRDLQQTKTPF